MPTSATGIKHVLYVNSPSKCTACVTTQNAVLHIAHLRHLLSAAQVAVITLHSAETQDPLYYLASVTVFLLTTGGVLHVPCPESVHLKQHAPNHKQ